MKIELLKPSAKTRMASVAANRLSKRANTTEGETDGQDFQTSRPQAGVKLALVTSNSLVGSAPAWASCFALLRPAACGPLMVCNHE